MLAITFLDSLQRLLYLSEKERVIKIYQIYFFFCNFRVPEKHGIWKPFDSTLLNFLSITSNHTKMKTKLRADKMIFWNNLVPKLVLSYKQETPPEPPEETEVIHIDFEMMFWVFTISSIVLMLIFIPLSCKLYRLQKCTHHATHEANGPEYIVRSL